MPGKKQILVVDDIQWMRELVSVFLARHGRVITAQSGPEALELARAQRPDLVLADLAMPGFDGEALCRAIRSEPDPELSATPIVILMGSRDAHDHARVVRAGADDLLTKPLVRHALLECVNRFLRHERVCGQPRVELDAPVRMRVDISESWGTVRNLSRGGLYVEAPALIPHSAEVELAFTLPDSQTEFHPTAQVVWNTAPNGREPAVGLGMRFVELDADAIHTLEDFVFENSRPLASTSVAGAA